MKPTRTKPLRNGARTAANLLQSAIDALRRDPAARSRLGIDLYDLQLAETIKRRLLRESKTNP